MGYALEEFTLRTDRSPNEIAKLFRDAYDRIAQVTGDRDPDDHRRVEFILQEGLDGVFVGDPADADDPIAAPETFTRALAEAASKVLSPGARAVVVVRDYPDGPECDVQDPIGHAAEPGRVLEMQFTGVVLDDDRKVPQADWLGEEKPK